MKRKITAIVLGSLLLGLVIVLPPATAGVAGPEASSFAFAPRFAGTYLCHTEAFGGLDGLQTFSADGTQIGTNTNCCGGAGNIQSQSQGVWEKTGPGQATLTAIIFGFDLDGLHVWTARITEVLTFDEDYETAEGACITELFWPGEDPQTAEPWLVVPWTDSWTRLHVVVE
jgi:hypothetical protein